jgi:hypothetical protein
MLDGTAGCEGARNGEEDDFLVGPFGAGVVVCWDSAGGYVVVFRRVGDVARAIRRGWDGGI